jgi:hypothetical protein
VNACLPERVLVSAARQFRPYVDPEHVIASGAKQSRPNRDQRPYEIATSLRSSR